MTPLEALTQRSHEPRPLDDIKAQLTRLGNPDRAFRTIQVAGTNGKGSVSSMLASILQACGLGVGLFTSPALTDIRERVRFNGEMISKHDLSRFAELVLSAERRTARFSGFDRLTLLAALYFADKRADAAVFECGLGGRLDPTTALKRHCTVLTRVALDHTELLGETILEIAEEKACVLQNNVPAVVAPQEEAAMNIINAKAQEVSAPVFQVLPENIELIESGLWGQTFSLAFEGHNFESLSIPFIGGHQLENAALAVGAAYVFHPPEEDALRSGLEGARWPCRFECFPATEERPLVVLDGAHNPNGAKALAESVQAVLAAPPALFFAAREGKDAKSMLETLAPAVSRVLLAEAGEGYIAAETLAAYCAVLELDCELLTENTLQAALEKCGGEALVCAGSLYFVGKLREELIGIVP